MAVTNEQSAQMVSSRLYPVEYHGKLRMAYFDFTQSVAIGDALSTVNLCRLPYGRIRIFPQMSRISSSAFGASRLLDVGHRAYVGESKVAVAEDLDALAVGIDISAAVAAGVPISGGAAVLLKFDMFSKGDGINGVIIAAQVRGGTIPAAATLKGYIVYAHE